MTSFYNSPNRWLFACEPTCHCHCLCLWEESFFLSICFPSCYRSLGCLLLIHWLWCGAPNWRLHVRSKVKWARGHDRVIVTWCDCPGFLWCHLSWTLKLTRTLGNACDLQGSLTLITDNEGRWLALGPQLNRMSHLCFSFPQKTRQILSPRQRTSQVTVHPLVAIRMLLYCDEQTLSIERCLVQTWKDSMQWAVLGWSFGQYYCQ